tara:strand:+ start:1513 stop:2103 length:591 start_codon:yes stop_codon:yes gene_type:complete
MNKKELYELCKEQQGKIKKMKVDEGYHEDIINDYDDDSDNLLEQIKKLKEENEKSKKENGELKETINITKGKLSDLFKVLKPDCGYYLSHKNPLEDMVHCVSGALDKFIDWDEEKYIQEITKLKEEINTTKSIEWIAKSMSDLQYEYQKLKKENEKLEEIIKSNHTYQKFCEESMNELQLENKELQMKYDKLNELF